MDLTTNPPQPIGISKSLTLNHSFVRDFCYLNMNNKVLFVYACWDGVFAQNVKTSELEWSITETTSSKIRLNVCSITTDGSGHIFIADTSSCLVLMFSSDRVELGTVMDLKEIGMLGPIYWCESLMSLVVPYEVCNYQWKIVAIDFSDVSLT